MTAEERAKKSVEAAIKRFDDGRVVVYVEPSDDATTSILSAGAAVKKRFKPTEETLLDRTNRRVGLRKPSSTAPIGASGSKTPPATSTAAAWRPSCGTSRKWPARPSTKKCEAAESKSPSASSGYISSPS
jgi:hypothetical protein